MRSLYRLVVPLRAILQKRQVEQDLDEELRFHLEMEIAQNIRRGMSSRHARTVALRNFGGLEKFKEECREQGGCSKASSRTSAAASAVFEGARGLPPRRS